MKIIYIAIVAAIVIIIFYLILCILDKRALKRNAVRYVKLFREFYETNTVLNTLQLIQNEFKTGSVEFIIIDRAIHYLNFSILKDYKTAFCIIEKEFHLQEVKQLHQEILEKETSTNLVLGITQKNT